MSLRFEVHVNGHKACTCGTDDLGVLSVVVDWVRRRPDGYRNDPESPDFTLEQWSRERLHLTAGGLDSSDRGKPKQLHWLSHDLAVGDEVCIRVLPPGECDESISQDQPPSSPSQYPAT